MRLLNTYYPAHIGTIVNDWVEVPDIYSLYTFNFNKKGINRVYRFTSKKTAMIYCVNRIQKKK